MLEYSHTTLRVKKTGMRTFSFSCICIYQTTKHTTIGLSPYDIFFGINPPTPDYLEKQHWSLRANILELRSHLWNKPANHIREWDFGQNKVCLGVDHILLSVKVCATAKGLAISDAHLVASLSYCLSNCISCCKRAQFNEYISSGLDEAAHAPKHYKNKHFTPFNHSPFYSLNEIINCRILLYIADVTCLKGMRTWLLVIHNCQHLIHVGCVGFKSQAKPTTWFCRQCQSS